MKKITALACAAALLLCSCGDEIQGEYIPPESYAESEADLSAVTNNSSNDSLSSDCSSDLSDTSSVTESEPQDESDTDSKSDEGKNGTEIYDCSQIVDAYLSGDTSALSDFDLAIYNKAVEVIEQCITDDMSDYQKELAVHDYIIYNCTYDEDALEAIPHPAENSINPYGTLIDGKAICMGYTTSFKMFMDMLEIPCGIVHSVDGDGDEHAWNTVQLEDNWYYVDVTWDDPVPDYDGRLVTHKYFNLSKEEMSKRHVLPDGTPETNSTEYSFVEQSLVHISDLAQTDELITAAVENKTDSIVIQFDESFGVEIIEAIPNEDYDIDNDNEALRYTLQAVENQGLTNKELEIHLLSDGSFALEMKFENDKGT